jgi:hypothetical protein
VEVTSDIVICLLTKYTDYKHQVCKERPVVNC